MITSPSQYQLMVRYMRRNGDISQLEVDLSNRKWTELTKILNSDRTGDTKSLIAWRKVWKNLKTRAKNKSAKIRKASSGSGAYSCFVALSDMETDVMNILRPSEIAGSSADLENQIKVKTEPPEMLLASSTGEALFTWNNTSNTVQHNEHVLEAPALNNTNVLENPEEAARRNMKVEVYSPPAGGSQHTVSTRINKGSFKRRPRKRMSLRPSLLRGRELDLFQEYLQLWRWQLQLSESYQRRI